MCSSPKMPGPAPQPPAPPPKPEKSAKMFATKGKKQASGVAASGTDRYRNSPLTLQTDVGVNA